MSLWLSFLFLLDGISPCRSYLSHLTLFSRKQLKDFSMNRNTAISSDITSSNSISQYDVYTVQQGSFQYLSQGSNINVLYARPVIDSFSKIGSFSVTSSSSESMKPPLLFIHGSFHGGWCFQEYFLPYFASLGYDSYAVDLRGTNGSAVTTKASSVLIDEHIKDLSILLTSLSTFPETSSRQASELPPVVIAHSLGGLITMKLLELDHLRPSISGTALLCSVPPTGNGQMSIRFLKRSVLLFWKIFRGFVFKAAIKDEKLCQELFFDEKISIEDVQKYMSYLQRDSKVTINIRDLNTKWPSKDASKRAPWLAPGQSGQRLPKRLVIGGAGDMIVDNEGVSETAYFLGCEPPTILDAYHDLMLGSRWPVAAEAIRSWLETEF